MTEPNTGFSVDLGSAYLTIDEVWPDGDAPENPTAQDVIEVMRQTSLRAYVIASEWNLLDGIEVTGNGDGRSASL
jgi:hypothetical protein